jgi:hypothetical protein
MMNFVGMNPYKVVKMWKNYRPNVPPEYHDNVLYAELMTAQWAKVKVEWAKVKVERADQAEFRAANKRKKYATAEMIESIAFNDEVEIMDSDGGK